MMALKELVDYIRTYSSQGYSMASIRSNLLASGYTPQQIDAAVNESFHGKTQIPWKLLLFGVAGLVLIIILIYGLVILLTPSSSVLKGTIAGAPSTLTKEQSLTFTRTIITGSEEPITVSISYSVVHDKTREKVVTKDEKATVRANSKKKISLQLDPDSRSGKYTLTMILKGDGQSTTKTHAFSYGDAGAAVPSTKTDIKDKRTIQLTTPTKPLSTRAGACHPTCNDYDPCTLDKCISGACVFEAKRPCCGNFECEVGETENTCSQDCKVRPLTQGESIIQIRRRAEEAATSNPQDGVLLCKSIAVKAQADSCLKTVAYASKQSDICSHISGSKLRDACYLDFALKNKQANVCVNVQDRWMKQSCVVYTTKVFPEKIKKLLEKENFNLI